MSNLLRYFKIVFILFLYPSLGFSQNSSTLTKLEEILNMIDQGEIIESEKLISNINTNDQTLKTWLSLANAKLLKHKGEISKSKQLLKKISKDSATYMDAQVLELEMTKKFSSLSIEKLEDQLRKARRNDLIAKVQLIIANAIEIANNENSKLKAYQRIRKEYKETIPAKKAQQLSANLITSSFSDILPEILISEAELLIKEKKNVEAIEITQKLREKSPADSGFFYHALAIEEQALRNMGRKLEADDVLSLLSKKAPIEISSQALFQKIRIAWNAQELDRAIDLSEQFFEEYEDTSIADLEIFWTVKYYHARILEEKGLAADALEIYEELRDATDEVLEKLKPLHQIAWIHYKNHSLDASKKAFISLKETASLYLSEHSTAKDRNEVEQEYRHSLYWLGELSESRNKTDSQNNQHNIYWNELIKRAPYSYYAILSVKKQGKVFRIRQINPKACKLLDSTKIETKLQKLKQFDLNRLAKHEINWFMANIVAEQNIEVLTRASLFSKYVGAKQSMSEVNTLTYQNDLRQECKSLALSLNYPHEYLNEFYIAANKNNLSLSLLLAVSRTESAFDPKAESSASAKGLMQLISQTAKEEGLKDNESLFNPHTNITLGAKHLAGLLNKFNSNEVKAIAAYNGGSKAVERWEKLYPNLAPEAWTEMIGYVETRNYVKKVINAMWIYETM